MKIDGTSISPVGGVQAAGRVKSLETKKSAAGLDNVAVSNKAQSFQSLLQKAKELPSVREERVQNLSDMIGRGEFIINSQRIADKLLSGD
jgi:negative regulator of flagellin synthesis FlgM